MQAICSASSAGRRTRIPSGVEVGPVPGPSLRVRDLPSNSLSCNRERGVSQSLHSVKLFDEDAAASDHHCPTCLLCPRGFVASHALTRGLPFLVDDGFSAILLLTTNMGSPVSPFSAGCLRSVNVCLVIWSVLQCEFLL